MRNTGLKDLSEFKVLPKLKYIDFSKNKISDLNALVKMLSRSPFLEVVRMSENPVCDKKVCVKKKKRRREKKKI